MENQTNLPSLNKPYKGYSIVGAYLKMLRTFHFSGRATRSEYWKTVLANIILTVLYSILMAILRDDSTDQQGVGYLILFFIWRIYYIATIWQTLALAARRLHDTGKSAWMLLLSLIPVVGTIILLVFLCGDSERGTNKFGESEKYPTK